jgi:ribonucleoside-triphosphate reductase
MARVKITGENAADRMTYVGEIFTVGEQQRKQEVLASLPAVWSELHQNGYIHIHDLDAYGLTYNCLAFDIREFFPYERFKCYSNEAKIIGLFDFLKEFLTKLGNEQSGGMAFPNFDIEIAEVLEKLGIPFENLNKEVLKGSIASFIIWCNNSHERMGKVSYYVSLNLGLANSDYSRFVCYTILDEFEKTNALTYKPNIIFKVKNGINTTAGTPNYSLFQKALHTTVAKMIPTYLLCDSKPNKDFDPYKLAIMGCRTRVVADKYGCIGSAGRGNITNTSVNLPRIALETNSIDSFLEQWKTIATNVSHILEDRYNKLINTRTVNDFLLNSQYDLWCVPFKNELDNVFKHGTLSIGFIGLAEAVEILTEKKFYKDKNAYQVALRIVEYMRNFIDNLRDNSKFNYSLLATSGEQISGRFVNIDKSKGYHHKVMKKNFYTNSFHVEVDSEISAFDKIRLESPFHNLCNGGCISYIELKEIPLHNEKALEELVNYATTCGTHYLGFNYDLDICAACGNKGIFDECSHCGNPEIIRIRRVSGYLEILDYFTVGKKNEVKHRTKNNTKKI